MRTTIDFAGRIAVPKELSEQLGLSPGTELELNAVDGRLVAVVAYRVGLEEGPHGVRLTAGPDDVLTAEEVRGLMDRR